MATHQQIEVAIQNLRQRRNDLKLLMDGRDDAKAAIDNAKAVIQNSKSQIDEVKAQVRVLHDQLAALLNEPLED